MQPIDRSTAWPYDEHGEPGPFVYQRQGHPAGAEAERALGELEGGEALLYGSGTSAVTACALALCRPGSTVALAAGAYFGTGVALSELRPWGLEVVEYDQTGPPPRADVVWVEAPANPLLTMPDWDAVRAFRAGGGRVVCDATVATPVYLHALDEGADVVVHSATKYLTGHRNALLGATATRDEALGRRLYELRTRLGLTASPESAAALLESLPTLEQRVRRQSATAAELAGRLERHPAVLRVRYPGVGGLVSFDVSGRLGAGRRDRHDADREHDLARRRPLVDREPPPLGGRPGPARAAAAVRGHRGHRGALGRPRRRARPRAPLLTLAAHV